MNRGECDAGCVMCRKYPWVSQLLEKSHQEREKAAAVITAGACSSSSVRKGGGEGWGTGVRMRMRMRTRCICVMWCSLVFRDGRGCRIQLNPRTWPSKISGREQSKFICRGRVVEATYGEGVKKQKKRREVKRERNKNLIILLL